LDVGGGRQQPPTVLARSQQRGKASGRIEAGKTKPVNRTVAPDEGRRLAVSD
jgi:hypothetical protein